MLTELSKVNAPSLLLHEFNYYFNKAINQYINKNYNIYDVNQQTSDNLRVLKATAILTPRRTTLYPAGTGYTNIWEVTLPDDYLHMLNCVCVYKMKQSYKCYDKDEIVDFSAKRLTADSWSTILNDYYNRPLPERPYYYIHNVNISDKVPTNPLTTTNPTGTDLAGKYQVSPTEHYINGNTPVYMKDGVVYTDPECTVEYSNPDISTVTKSNNSNLPRTITLGEPDNRIVSTVERDTGTRYGNASKVRCEIRYGKDSSVFELQQVLIDYIKAPQTIRLTRQQVDLTEDTSQIMEFPDYVCQEIINELVLLVMARDADPRLSVQADVTQSIANPAQQQTQPKQQV